jgi:hypothetical protein
MSYTTTRATTITATETRVKAVLRQVNVDMLAAVACGLVSDNRVRGWKNDLQYMLCKNALVYFELRVQEGGTIRAAWRYEISDDGSLLSGTSGGGLNFYAFSSNASISLIIKRRLNLSAAVNDEIDRRGWTTSVKSLAGVKTRERAYCKDGYGVIRHQLNVE